jgi:exosortase family protein XrtF
VATHISGGLLRLAGWDVEVADHPSRPRTYISWNNSRIVSVFEGCNGINVEIVFLTFLVSFGPWNLRLLWFAIAGSIVVYVMNITRIIFLFWVTIKVPDYFYFVHKYLFTASIYVIVFALWLWWVAVLSRTRVNE